MRLFRQDRATAIPPSWAAVTVVLLLVQSVAVWALARTRPAGALDALIVTIVTVAAALGIGTRARGLRANDRDSARSPLVSDDIGLLFESAHAVAWDWDVESGVDMFCGDLAPIFGISAWHHAG